MNNHMAAEVTFFKFEEDFIEAGIRCIPMIVRFKLDACGIKLKLSEWSKMTPAERAHLAEAPCEEAFEVLQYRQELYDLVIHRTGEAPTLIPVEQNPAWSRMDEIPYTVNQQLKETSHTCTLQQWQSLSPLQRFALMKLSYSGHENKNFPRALAEFGLSAG